MIAKHPAHSALAKDLVTLSTPCNDVIYYPAKLAILAAEEGIYSVFQVFSEKSGLAYIVVTHPNTAEIVLAGSKNSINKIYQAIPWSNYQIVDGDNQFYYKELPSLQASEDYFIDLKEQ